MLFLTVSMCVILTLYVYYLQRSLILARLRKDHSKSYLKKVFCSAPKIARVTGFYLYIDRTLRKNWLLSTLLFANLNLLDILIVILFWINRNHLFFDLVRLLALKDFIIIFVVYINAKKLSR